MKVRFLRQAHRFIRRSKGKLRIKIQEEIDKIIFDPFSIGEKLVKSLKGLKSHHFTCDGVHYRVVFMIKGDLIIIAIASRENFYRDLEKNRIL